MKDLGSLSYFLGLQFTRSSSGIFLHQKKYIEDIIALAHLTDNRIAETPSELNAKYSRSEGSHLRDATMYCRLVGNLMYLTMTTPDIAHVVQLVSQFVSNPHRPHLTAVHCIVRYLCGRSDKGLFYSSRSLHLTAYADVDWAGCPDTRRSTTRWCTFLGKSLIS